MAWFALSLILLLLIAGSIGLFYSPENVREAVLAWFFCSVAFGALPVVAAIEETWRSGGQLTVAGLLGKGELLLLAAALSADAVGKAVFCKAQKRAAIGTMSVAGTLLVCFSTFVFVSISKSTNPKTDVLERGGLFSLAIFVAAIVLSGACIITVESLKEKEVTK